MKSGCRYLERWNLKAVLEYRKCRTCLRTPSSWRNIWCLISGQELCRVNNVLRRYNVLPSFSPRDDRCVASRFFSVNMKVSSQGNLRGRSLKGDDWHSNTHLVLGYVYLLMEVHCRITTEYYKMLWGVSTAFWLTSNCHFSFFQSSIYLK
jgi:hypothetical protein